MAAIDRILTSAEALATAEAKFEECKNRVQTAYLQMTSAVFTLDTTWNGEASEAFKNQYNDLQNNLKSSDTTLEKAINDLKQAKVIYNDVETQLQAVLAAMEDTTDPFAAG